MQHVNLKDAEIIFKALAEVLREEREKQGKSQRLLADEFALQHSMISRLEKGLNEPKFISLWSLAEALGMKLSDLIKLVEDRLPAGFSLLDL